MKLRAEGFSFRSFATPRSTARTVLASLAAGDFAYAPITEDSGLSVFIPEPAAPALPALS